MQLLVTDVGKGLDFGLYPQRHLAIEWKVVKLLASEPNRKLELAGYAASMVRIEGD